MEGRDRKVGQRATTIASDSDRAADSGRRRVWPKNLIPKSPPLRTRTSESAPLSTTPQSNKQRQRRALQRSVAILARFRRKRRGRGRCSGSERLALPPRAAHGRFGDPC